MDNIFLEIFIVLLLTLLNGFFACSEIALISVRKTRIASLAKQGNRRANIILQLHKNPESLFATMQIGISLITIVASAFAGASIAEDLSKYIGKLDGPFIERNSYPISFALIVILVSYFNLIIGELVPKSLGLRYAETFSLFAAYPIWWLSKASYWLIKLLSFSSNLILKLFKDSTTFTESRLSEEEIRTLISESRQAGVIAPEEHYMLENVFEFSDLTVGQIMTPRIQIVAFNIEQDADQIIRQAVNSDYSRVPIYQDTLNNVIGILYTKKLLDSLGKNSKKRVQDFLTPPYFVPNSMKISEVLRRLQRKKVPHGHGYKRTRRNRGFGDHGRHSRGDRRRYFR
ncbi:MAG: HlyC/CorC family transporter [Candidatus Doudnabacteria bacterium]|nr:HlyC/CorC family transporter [Candidatus Doudnabacteria bacterium]